MNPNIEISRDDLVAIIDGAIADATSLAPRDAEALRAVGRSASSVAVGSFELGPGCPVAQAGYRRLAFACGFDVRFGERCLAFACGFDVRFGERFPHIPYPAVVAVVG